MERFPIPYRMDTGNALEILGIVIICPVSMIYIKELLWSFAYNVSFIFIRVLP